MGIKILPFVILQEGDKAKERVTAWDDDNYHHLLTAYYAPGAQLRGL